MNGAPEAVDPGAEREAKGLRGLARGWWKRGRPVQAIATLERSLALDPAAVDGYLELGRIHLNLRRWDDLVDVASRGLRRFLDIAPLHKMLITGLEESGGWDSARARYRLERRDRGGVEIADDAIVCCLTARNESARLPFFLEYYRRLGVDRFLVVDNDSRDDSVEFLLRQPDVHVWSSDLSFRRANFGSAWFEVLLRRYGQGRWCLTVDADEFLLFEGAPRRTLREYVRDLESRGKRAATGMLVDLYGDRPVRETVCPAGEDPLRHCRFLDRRVFHRRDEGGGPHGDQPIFWGGVRRRVFPVEHDYLLSKCVLLEYRPDVVLEGGQHFTNIPAERLAIQETCLLHFKFLETFVGYAREEAERGVHGLGAEQYKGYRRVLDDAPDVCLHDPLHSVPFEGTAQLRDLGVLLPEGAVPAATPPPIAPLSEPAAHRPFWSVMVTVLDRTAFLGRAVRSVVEGADDDTQIEVVCDSDDPAVVRAIEAETARVAGDRVRVNALGRRLGHPAVFDRCIELARGRWVHILHDDDWVQPGFHRAMRLGVESCPEAGAAFCRHRIADRMGPVAQDWDSWVERETPGIVEGWLDRIAEECRVQFSAMVVRRDVYETVGGFLAGHGSAFDWEMWIRIAAGWPVFHLPDVLVNVGRDGSAESSPLVLGGGQVRDTLEALDMAARHFPPDRAEDLVRRGRERIAAGAFELAGRFLRGGDTAAALANLRAAASRPVSERTLRRMLDFLRGEDHEYRG